MIGKTASATDISGTGALHGVIYTSRFNPVRHDTIESCVARVLPASQRNNQRANVTGALLACDGWFLQVLEGRRIDVEHTLRRIEADPSHTAIRRISAGPIEQRRFGEWRMCASILSPTDAAIVRTLAASGKFDPNALTAEPALRLLGAVARLQGQAA